MTRPRRFALRLVVAGAVIAALAGCTQPEPMPTPEPSVSSSATPSAEPTTPPVGANMEGTAADNQAFFDETNRALIDSGVALNGEAFVANLERVGYPRSAMEVTPDQTSIGIAADNIVFSINFGETCLLGQWGNIGYTSLVTEVTSTGRCIIGTAHPA